MLPVCAVELVTQQGNDLESSNLVHMWYVWFMLLRSHNILY